MLNSYDKVEIWEGLGGISLLGLGVSSIYSFSCLWSLVYYWNHNFISPQDLHKNISKYENKEIYISGHIKRLEIQNTNTSSSQLLTEKANYRKELESLGVITRKKPCITFSEYSSIIIKWDDNTQYDFKDTHINDLSIGKIIINYILSPFSIAADFIMKKLFGLKTFKENLSRTGQETYMYGRAFSGYNYITFLASFITDDETLLESTIRRKLLWSLVTPLVCAVGVFFCYKNIKKIENKNGYNKNVKANRNFKCWNCKNFDSEYIIEPCRHLCLCYACNETTKQCPVCKIYIKHTIHIFLG